ncbi:MAG: hypothetical protein ACLFR1_14160 [Spirochaetia bacterium]
MKNKMDISLQKITGASQVEFTTKDEIISLLTFDEARWTAIIIFSVLS